ncbi:hypothetical protein MP228_006411 [Amoeboaphelidium protococcarum]|nr:hypothetical protein MP228_006411 [Amoeboaphelidium protococcarum]
MSNINSEEFQDAVPIQVQSTIMIASYDNVKVVDLSKNGAKVAEGTLQVWRMNLDSAQQQQFAQSSGNHQTVPMHLLGIADTDFSIPLTPQSQVYKQGDNGFVFPNADSSSALFKIEISPSSNDQSGSSADKQKVDNEKTDQTQSQSPVEQFEQFLAHHSSYQLAAHKGQLAIVDTISGQIQQILDSSAFKQITESVNGVLMTAKHVVMSKTEPVVFEAKDSVMGIAEKVNQDDVDFTEKAIDTSASDQHQQKSMIRSMADSAVKSSMAVSSGMISAAQHLGTSMHSTKDYLKQKITPNDKATIVSPIVKSYVKFLRSGTKSIGYVTRQFTKVVVYSSEQFGNMLMSATGMGRAGQQRTDFWYAMAQSMVAASNVMSGVEQSVRIITEESGKATIELITHRYGDDAGQFAGEVVGIGQDLVLVYFDAQGLSRRVIIKNAAKGILKVQKQKLVDADQLIVQKTE